MPRLPREIKVDVTKCHACHAEVARRHGRHGRLNQDQARHPVPSVPRLPRKTTVDVRLCHACHVKSRWMSPSATPATQSGAASRAPKPRPSAPASAICTTPATQNHGRCQFVPRLPREIKVDVTKCHACHAEVARRHGRHGRLNQDQARHPVPSVPRLPRKTTVDVRLCHACHVKRRWMSPSATHYYMWSLCMCEVSVRLLYCMLNFYCMLSLCVWNLLYVS